MTSTLVSHYAAVDIEARILTALDDAGFDLQKPISPEDLGALDHFHTGGIRASHELRELAGVSSSDHVLDIGAGLGGCARLLASVTGCRVECLDLTPDYCRGARLLNRLTGLDERVGVHEGSALALPFADASFDVVWMQNVGMNIHDKRQLYAEIRRVLKPGGRYAFQEMAAGVTPTAYFPLPWATEPGQSTLITPAEMETLLAQTGFHAVLFEDTSEAHIARSSPGGAVDKLTLRTYVEELGEKATNARRSLEEGQIRFVRGVFRAV